MSKISCELRLGEPDTDFAYALPLERCKNCNARPAATSLSIENPRGQNVAPGLRMAHGKHFVYVLRSIPHPDLYYTGLSSDVARRLETHNAGGSQYTAPLRPWELVVSLEFSYESSAVAFERYLKSGSGRAFAKRHLV